VGASGKKWFKVERRAKAGVLSLNNRLELMFLGQYHHNLDEKGRLTIPARFRDVLAIDGAYILQGFDNNLMVVTAPKFDALSQRINGMSMTDPSARLLRRLFFSTADRLEVDRSGRILIPQFLRQVAGLDGDVVIVGVGDYFEVWSASVWSNQLAQIQDVDANSQRFMSLDLFSN
jgi:MraZ protein